MIACRLLFSVNASEHAHARIALAVFAAQPVPVHKQLRRLDELDFRHEARLAAAERRRRMSSMSSDETRLSHYFALNCWNEAGGGGLRKEMRRRVRGAAEMSGPAIYIFSGCW